MSSRDDLPDRLGQLFQREASKITSPPDAWERFSDQAGRRLVGPPSSRRQRAWVGVPVGLVAAAAVIAVVVAVGSGGSSRGKSSSAAVGAIRVEGGANSAAAPAAAAAPGPATSGSAASGAAASGSGVSGPAASSSALAPGSPSSAQSPSAAPSTIAGPGSGQALAAPSGGPIPSGFEPASVTFVSASEGWVLGTAPCSSAPCTSILRTSDGGRTWQGIPAPRIALSEGATQNPGSGVSGLRFADPEDGWAFGPDLWETHDGGATWQAVSLPGVPAGGSVVALEAAAGSVTAVVMDGNGHVHIESSPAGRDAWELSPVSIPIGAGPVPSSQLVLHGTSGWMVEVDRTVVGGARLTDGQWQSWTPPCLTGGGGVELAASSSVALAADCSLGIWTGTPQGDHLFVSGDGGTTFSEAPAAIPSTSGAGAIASPSPSVVVVGGSDLVATFDGGQTWTTVYTAPSGGGPGFRLVGFTTPDQGVAIAGSAGQGSTMLMTRDGGHSWSVVSF